MKIAEGFDYDAEQPEISELLAETVIKAYELADEIGIDLDKAVREAYKK